MPFGANLKRLLDARGMSVTELAGLTGLNRGTLYSYLRRDTKKVDPAVVKKLIAVLGPEASVLYDVDDVTEIIWDENAALQATHDRVKTALRKKQLPTRE